MNKIEYDTKLQSENNSNLEKIQDNMLGRENLYQISKPRLRLDNDLKK